MDAGLGGGNGFMFRTRREEDAKAFQDEWAARGGGRDVPTRPTLIIVSALVLVLLVLGVLAALG